ncbi:MAG TPA: hypothetical protein VJ722_09550 [Rhodanobacteraceae bacterium]|nr:hypothetical protein [Rhodanobacteraceae bacterium]
MRKLILPALVAAAFASPTLAQDAQTSQGTANTTEQAAEPVVSSDVKRRSALVRQISPQTATSGATQGSTTPANASTTTTTPSHPAASTSG